MRAKLNQTDLAAVLGRCQRGMLTRRRLMMSDTPDKPTDLEQALLDAVTLFDQLGIRYALVGGLAAMVYGKSRFTEDVDFVAEAGHMDQLNAQPDAMRQHGFDPGCTWKLYHRSGVMIDLWKDAFADQIVGRAQTVRLAHRSVCIATVEDLVAMKLRADRPQDEYDISEILKANVMDEELLQTRITPAQAKRLIEIKQRIGLADGQG